MAEETMLRRGERKNAETFAGAERPMLHPIGWWHWLEDVRSGGAVFGRRCMTGLLSAALLACGGALPAQGGSDAEPLGALRHGQLVVWYLSASARPQQSNLDAVAALHNATPLDYQEHTAGSFGQTASSYGQSAGSYGEDADTRSIGTPTTPPEKDAPTATPNGIGYRQQEASTLGQNAAGYGSESSAYGKESSSLGQSAGGYGQSAGGYGTDASNVGQSASDFGAGKSANAQSASPPEDTSDVAQQTVSDPAAEQVKESLQHAFPDLQMRFMAVDPDQLKARLMAASGSADYPDVLLGTLPAAWSNGMDGEFGLAMLQPATFYPNGVTDNPPGTVEVAILAHAQHMQTARALALWLSEPYSGCPGCVRVGLSGNDAAAAGMAKSALERLVSGQPVGDAADPELAQDSSRGVRRMLATMGSKIADDNGVRVQVENVSTNGSLAAVALRVVVSSQGVFGVAHPLVVLRAGKDGQWRVLQLSLNLPEYEQANERRALVVSAPPSAAEQHAGVKGVTQATPQDGQTLTQVPQLVWDNHGGAGLQVVEWQRGDGGGWSDARLYLVEDRNQTLRTNVLAEFASANGRYRWRVWSVGAQGEVQLSPWRTFRLAQ
jgi:hypothetical protein